MIRIVIIDDHEMLLEGVALALALEPDIEIVGTALSRSTGAERCRALQPDVVVVDYRIDGETGADLARDLRAIDPEAVVIGMSAVSSTTVVDEMVGAGCVSFVPKQHGISALAGAIRAAHNGFGQLPRGTARSVGGEELSPRELEILQLMSEGNTASDIAQGLQLSLHTVRNHIREIRRKLDVTSQLAAVATGVRTGLIQGPLPH